MDVVTDNFRIIKRRVGEAAARVNRDPKGIKLIGVTKNVGVLKINDFLRLGNRDIAENKVQELLSKYEQIGDTADWHFIGHLQTNKVRSVITKAKLIQSLDSYKLAVEIDKRARELGVTVNTLIEINIAGESSKFGIAPSECRDFISELLKFDSIKLKGLMTVAPFVERPDENRFYFKKMMNLFIDNQNYFNNNVHMDILSMGMTNDFEIAVEEGANMLRIGTGIFGERDY